MTFLEQAAGFVATLVLVGGFIGVLVLYTRAGRGVRVAIAALSWVLAVALYHVIFFALPEGSGAGYVSFMVLAFVFAFWGVIDLAIHSNARLRGGGGRAFSRASACWSSRSRCSWRRTLCRAGSRRFRGTWASGPTPSASSARRSPPSSAFGRARGASTPTGRPFRLCSPRERPAVEVAPKETSHLPGETVRATVLVTSRRDFEVAGARAELLYTSRYSHLSPDPRGGSLLVDGTDREVVAAEDLPIGGTVRGGGRRWSTR